MTDNGIAEVKALGEEILENSEKYNIGKIFSSDLERASQTAQILSDILGVEVEYPNLYWSTLPWEEKYPDGESPKEFYERVKTA